MSVNRTPRRRFGVVAAALTLALAATACTGDDGPDPGSDPSASLQEPGDAPTLEVQPVTTSGRLVGQLPRKDRARVEQAVSRVAVRWMDDAFLGGRYPRKSFGNSFAVFTGGARAAARRDLGRMTNDRIGRRVDEVIPTAVRVRVDLLAVRKRAVTATARVGLRFRTEGAVAHGYHVFGRLMMTRRETGWRVFGYDVVRTRQGARAPARSTPRRETRGGRADRGKRGNRGRTQQGGRA